MRYENSIPERDAARSPPASAAGRKIAAAAMNATGSAIPSAVPTELTTGNETKASAPKPAMLVRSEHRTGFTPRLNPAARKMV